MLLDTTYRKSTIFFYSYKRYYEKNLPIFTPSVIVSLWMFRIFTVF